MSSVRALLMRAGQRLHGCGENPALDSQVLLAHVLGRDRAWLYAWPEHALTAAQIRRFEALVEARAAGHPVAHLTGRREFWSLDLAVSRDTLIPRPETEHLVEIAADLALPDDARVLDLGTGSGAIALALASEHRDWQVLATDASAAAIDVARDNASRLGLGNIRFATGDWFDAVDVGTAFDLIVSNPPYVAADDPHLRRGDVRFEPAAALVSGDDGLDDIRRIVADAGPYLRPGGWLWLEHGHQQGNKVIGLLRRQGFAPTRQHPDLAGHARHTGGRRPVSQASADSG